MGPLLRYISEDGSQLIEPVWNGEQGLVSGRWIYSILCPLPLVLFFLKEVLTLKRYEIKNVGSCNQETHYGWDQLLLFLVEDWLHIIFLDLSWQISFLFSALIIVTGPTVITPILRNIPLKKDVSAVLKWEGILIDPIGALVAVLVFEFISVGGDAGYTKQALIEFGKIILIGFSFGISGGYALFISIKKNWIPHYLLNVVPFP